MILGIVIPMYGIYHANDVQVVYRDVYFKNLPDELVNKKAVFISDTHYGAIHTKEKAVKDVELLKTLHPDILFIGGDFFDTKTSRMDEFVSPYANLQPQYGKYFVSGNHEVYADLTESNSKLSEVGFIITDNKNIDVHGLQILGIPYTTSNPSDLDKETTLKLLDDTRYDKAKPSILLKHVPIDTTSMSEKGISFAFFGHTHYGQIFPFSLITKRIYGVHAYGFSSSKETLFYTSSGLGSWGPPQRIGTDSEILVVTMKKEI